MGAQAKGETKSEPLQPGMILGPDGKPCKVCTSFRNWKPPVPAGSTKQNPIPTPRPAQPPPNCPVDVEQLGRATWTFLHTTAAYYPDHPTLTQRVNMLCLIRSLPILYACSWCADSFGKNIKTHPPDVSNGVNLSRWLCERHNDVNMKLGKPLFDCNLVDERWKDGPKDGSCD